MPKITIDGVEIECRSGIPVLQAALETGLDVPHYCYHPGLSVVASCRLCLMEMQMRSPKTGEMSWSPKLMPSCQTPVRDGMVVRFKSEAVRNARERCMEYFLLNHPLDCPICDQAGECYLQDYSYEFGRGTSRMVDKKYVNPKKDIGPRTLLYQDRCVMCSRCVRFADEVAGTGELCIVNRGNRAEIDVFPGKPLDNPIQGNVVDLCPVGCLLDKDFLFKQRVWFLERAPSICPLCSTGCAIFVDQSRDEVYRLKPRYNPGVNDWWMCDEGRFGFKYVHDPNRLNSIRMKRGGATETIAWESLPQVLRFRLDELVEEQGDDRIALVLSPFLACEEAWMLIHFMRQVAPNCTLACGPVPIVGEDQKFPVGAADDKVKFIIRNEKCPNRRGIELLIEKAGGPAATLAEFLEKAGKGEYAAAWITGGYPYDWPEKDLVAAAEKIGWLVVSDMLPNKLTAAAHLLIPSCAFAERDGSFMNAIDRIQPFERAVTPIDGCKRDGQFLYELAGFDGLYSGKRVREKMAAETEAFTDVSSPAPEPVHQH